MRRMPVLTFAVPALAAWAVLWWWTVAPVGARFEHAQLDRTSSPLALAVVGWVVMAVAMMLPTLPHPTKSLGIPAADVGVFGLGYLAVWTLIGMAVVTVDLGVHAIVPPSTDLRASVFVLSGSYQLSSRKQRCLTRWREPATWSTNAADRWCAFDRGARHAWRSVGCCWSLMLLTFALGLREFGWMVVIAAIMLFESRLRRPDRWARAAGVALIVAATLN